MSLKQDLVNARRLLATRLTEDKAAVLGVAETLLRGSGLLTQVRKPGDMAGNVELSGRDGPVDLLSTLARGPVVVTFVQGGWSPYCRLELAAWQRMAPYARALGATVLAVGPQMRSENERTRERLGLTFDLLTDPANRLAADWGLAYQLPPTMREIYRQLGVDLERINGDQGWTLPIPATYVLAPDGRIAAAFADLDVSRRMEPLDALMEAADLLAVPVE